MLKRDLGRLLGQVKRLSSRVKEASNGMGRGMEQLLANGEQTRQEIRDYFNRYQRELKKREENFLEQVGWLGLLLWTDKRGLFRRMCSCKTRSA
jgi:hypothetical protein